MEILIKTTLLALFVAVCLCNDHEFGGIAGHNRRLKRSTENYIPPDSPFKGTDWNSIAQKAIEKNNRQSRKMNKRKAKNVILFLGDGMGVTTTSVARLYKMETLNLKKVEDIYLDWESWPYSSLVRTYNADRSTPDSAATATAYLSGIKANLGTLGLNENVYFTKCYNVKNSKVDSILHKSIREGKGTGVVTTARITHASPAGAYASTPFREWEYGISPKDNPKNECEDIASQLVNDPRNAGINVLFGGGARNFLPEGDVDSFTQQPGKRADKQDLMKKWLEKKESEGKKACLIRDRKAFDELSDDVEHVMGLFASSHMSYELDRDPSKEPSLAEMTEKAIKILSKNDKGYFLFVEGAKIDQAHHENKAKKALADVLAMEQAVRKALEMVNLEETLVLVTADHSSAFVHSGFSLFQESILGFAEKLGIKAYDEKPYQQLFYASGPGQQDHRITMTSKTTFKEHARKDLTNSKDIYDKDYRQDSGIWTEAASHGGQDVAVYAVGPWSHLFQSTEEQTYVAHVMMYASCVGDYKNKRHCKRA